MRGGYIPPGEMRRIDQMSRVRWSVAAAIAMMESIPQDVRLQMVIEGPERFEGVARGHLAGHAFHQEDYRRMFNIIKIRTTQPDVPMSYRDMERL